MSETAEAKMIREFETILSPIITEKATMGSDRNEVTFKVPLHATKPQIKAAIESLFKVKVKSVNTLIHNGKVKNFRNVPFRKSDVKKAIVTLEEGHTIDIATGL